MPIGALEEPYHSQSDPLDKEFIMRPSPLMLVPSAFGFTALLLAGGSIGKCVASVAR